MHYEKEKEQFCDERDGKIYVYVDIGGQIWMAENLNYNEGGNSKCYQNQDSYCDIYGRMYDWDTAISACPTNWHLPSYDEWIVLSDYLGGSSTEGRHLNATRGWNGNRNGLDTYGFAALPGGMMSSSGDGGMVGNYGYWWTTRVFSNTESFCRIIAPIDFENTIWDPCPKSYRLSVRCVHD
jgi:uncharacterized protein (TIGR02145 family)